MIHVFPLDEAQVQLSKVAALWDGAMFSALLQEAGLALAVAHMISIPLFIKPCVFS